MTDLQCCSSKQLLVCLLQAHSTSNFFLYHTPPPTHTQRDTPATRPTPWPASTAQHSAKGTTSAPTWGDRETPTWRDWETPTTWNAGPTAPSPVWAPPSPAPSWTSCSSLHPSQRQGGHGEGKWRHTPSCIILQCFVYGLVASSPQTP